LRVLKGLLSPLSEAPCSPAAGRSMPGWGLQQRAQTPPPAAHPAPPPSPADITQRGVSGCQNGTLFDRLALSATWCNSRSQGCRGTNPLALSGVQASCSAVTRALLTWLCSMGGSQSLPKGWLSCRPLVSWYIPPRRRSTMCKTHSGCIPHHSRTAGPAVWLGTDSSM
jgi:hypothetical protein